MRNKVKAYTHSVIRKIPLIAFAVFMAGCTTEYFKDKAADKARDYIFEQYPKMSPQNANYIKYTYPTFEVSRIYSTKEASDVGQYYWNEGNNYFNPQQYSKSRQFSQVAIAWDIPSPNATIMVLGTCYDNYWGWKPLKLIIRERSITPDTSIVKDTADTNRKSEYSTQTTDTATIKSV